MSCQCSSPGYQPQNPQRDNLSYRPYQKRSTFLTRPTPNLSRAAHAYPWPSPHSTVRSAPLHPLENQPACLRLVFWSRVIGSSTSRLSTNTARFWRSTARPGRSTACLGSSTARLCITDSPSLQAQGRHIATCGHVHQEIFRLDVQLVWGQEFCAIIHS